MTGFYIGGGSGKSKNGEDLSEGISGEAITAYQPVALIDGELFVGDNADETHCNRIVGLALNSATGAGQEVDVQSSGEVTNSGWSFTPGQRLFLGPNGAIITSISPSDTLMVPIGHAIDNDTIFIDIKPSIRRNC